MSDYEYTVIRSGRRTLSLEITPALAVVVRAPYACSEKQIAAFVQAHTAWLEKHMALQQQRQAAAAARQVTPEQEAAPAGTAGNPGAGGLLRRTHGADPGRGAYYGCQNPLRQLQQPEPPVFFLAADAVPAAGGGLCGGA